MSQKKKTVSDGVWEGKQAVQDKGRAQAMGSKFSTVLWTPTFWYCRNLASLNGSALPTHPSV